VVARDTEEEIAEGVQFVKQQIAFYGSTPAYRPVLELHGWGELQGELNARTKRGEWDNASLIDDEMVDAFAVVGTPEEAIAEVKRRYGDVCTRITLQLPEGADTERWGALFDELRGATADAL
jgi:alkanesulfonate monooxygenase SsuD/methylene tetrahydromethanopterin reductase-like flavin-dependent oxidoreductase (luciferase family)